MRLQDILFTGMDIPNEAQKMFDNFSHTDYMTACEEKVFKFGVSEALRAVRTLLNDDEHVVFHLDGHSCIEEFDLHELIEIVEEKEGC